MIDDCWVGKDLEGRGYCSNRGSLICLEGQSKTTKNLSHYCRCPGPDSNRAYLECFSRKLPLSLPSLPYKLLIASLNEPQICVLLLISVRAWWSSMDLSRFFLHAQWVTTFWSTDRFVLVTRNITTAEYVPTIWINTPPFLLRLSSLPPSPQSPHVLITLPLFYALCVCDVKRISEVRHLSDIIVT